MSWIGLDVGGANLKAASSEGRTGFVSFPLWQNPAKLADAIDTLLNQVAVPDSVRVAATMTGELADGYSSRRLGVAAIVDAVCESCTRRNFMPPTFVGTDLCWRCADDAKADWQKVAAANWAATAAFSTRFLPEGTGTFLDMGSTTTDIIPVREHRCESVGKTDFGRLENRELVYIGVGRTPVCSLISEFDFQQRSIPVAKEFFATIEDALIILNQKPEDESDFSTADGRSKTKANCEARICRMICEDAIDVPAEWIESFATQVVASAQKSISAALDCIENVSSAGGAYLVSGAGEDFLFNIVSQRTTMQNVVRLSEKLSPCLSKVASAYAVAVLASENGDQ